MKAGKPEAQKLAAFVGVEAAAVNAEMWPVHTLLWLQPDLDPARPQSSGLRIERRRKTPAPDFLPLAVPAADPAHTRKPASESLPPKLARSIPARGATPLGWDPRALKGGVL